MILAQAVHRADAFDVVGGDRFHSHDTREVDGKVFAVTFLKNEDALGVCITQGNLGRFCRTESEM